MMLISGFWWRSPNLDYRISALAPALKLLCGTTWRDRQFIHLIGTLTPFQAATACSGLVDKGSLGDALNFSSHHYEKDIALVHKMYSLLFCLTQS